MRNFLTGVALSVMVAGSAIAQAQGMIPPPGGPGGPGGPPPMMQPLTRAEVEAMVAKHFAALDLNKDGSVTREEIDAGRAKRREAMQAEMVARIKAGRERAFDRLDANKDGSISKQEFAEGPGAPPPPPGGLDRGPGMGPDGPHGGPDGAPGRGPRGGPEHGPRGPMNPGMIGGKWFDKADTNHNGKVTLTEAKAAALAAFDKADVNHDGTLDRDEMRAAMMMKMRGGWGGHGGRGGPDHDGPDGGPEGK